MARRCGFVSVLVSLVVMFSLLLVGCDGTQKLYQCNDRIGCVTIKPGEPLKLGVLQALSGDVASLGREQVRGIELALDERQGKVLGHSVHIQVEDTGCSPEGGANAALKLVADSRQVAILGTTCSGAAATASKIMSEAGLTMISGNNSAPFLTSVARMRGPEWQPGYFRTAPNEESAGKAAAIYAFNELKIKKAAVVNDGDIYTKGLTEGFREQFTELGGDVVLNTSVNKGDKEMQPVLRAVVDAQAELLFFPLFQPEGTHILLDAKASPDFKHIVLMSDGALLEASFLEATGELAKGMYFIGPLLAEGPESESLAARYYDKYKSFPSNRYYMSAYDATQLLISALEKIAVADAAGSLHVGRQALRKELYSIRDFKGVTASLSCDEFGDCALPAFNVLRLDNPAGGIEELLSNGVFSYIPEM